MPTGYTYGIEDGTITDFRTFALMCARAFGPCVMQREDHLKVLPVHRVPSSYYENRLKQVQRELTTLKEIPIEQAEKKAMEEYAASVRRYEDEAAKEEEVNARYDKMLAEVYAWEPPTPDHENLKKFMIQQLEDSKHKYYSQGHGRPEKLSGEEWLQVKVEMLTKDIEYCVKYYDEELDRCEKSNNWIDALYDNLKVEEEK
jgi:hypothetical protein